MKVKSLVVEVPAHAIRQDSRINKIGGSQNELAGQKGVRHLYLGSRFCKEKSNIYTRGIEKWHLMFSNGARFCYEGHFLKTENLPLPDFFKICASLTDTQRSPVIPHVPHPICSWLPRGYKRERGSSKASRVLAWNLAQCYFFHSSLEQSSHKVSSSQGAAGHGEGWRIEVLFASVSTTAVLSPKLGAPHSGSSGEKADNTSSERQMQQAGWEH